MKYLGGEGKKVLDVGAGTGKYSGYLYDKGYDVTSVELVKHNLMTIKKNYPYIPSYIGNALDLSRFDDNSFDAVILFGPMYHLISDDDKVRALLEAKRVVKNGGFIFISYYMNDYAIFKHGFLDRNILDSINNGLVDDIFKIECRVYDGQAFYIIPASLPTDNVPKYGVAIQSITKSKINIYTGTENKTRNMNCKMFIYYTKTTD